MSSRLDLKYIADLFEQARAGDSNAFAEFFAATSPQEYTFACSYLKDDYLAEEALRDTYVNALSGISKVRDSELILAWLTGINLNCCYEIERKHALYRQSLQGADSPDPESAQLLIEGTPYPMRQVLSLPFTEAQVLVLRYLCGMKRRKIARLTEIRPGDVRRCTEKGITRLNGAKGGAREKE